MKGKQVCHILSVLQAYSYDGSSVAELDAAGAFLDLKEYVRTQPALEWLDVGGWAGWDAQKILMTTMSVLHQMGQVSSCDALIKYLFSKQHADW